MSRIIKITGEIVQCNSFMSKNNEPCWKGAIDMKDIYEVLAKGNLATLLQGVKEGDAVEIVAQGPSDGCYFAVKVIKPTKENTARKVTEGEFIFIKDSPYLQRRQITLALEGISFCERETDKDKWIRYTTSPKEVKLHKGIYMHRVDYLQSILGETRVYDEFKGLINGPLTVLKIDPKKVEIKISELLSEADGALEEVNERSPRHQKGALDF